MTLPPIDATLLKKLGESAFTLALGGFGGVMFHLLRFPLPFMTGALTMVTVAAVAGVRARTAPNLRNVMVALLGVMLGSSFKPDILDHLMAWTISLIWLPPLIALTIWVGKLAMERWARLDPVTAYFASVPGGLVEMSLIGGSEGGDEKRLLILHALRIVITVMLLPFWFRFTTGYVSPDPSLSFTPWPGTKDLAILAACAVCGYCFARFLRLPAPQLTGAMLLSAMAHLSGWTQSSPPDLLIAAAQTIVGASLGARFHRTPLRFFLPSAGMALVLTLLMLAICMATAGIVHAITGLSFHSALLAFAPGGLSEMSLIALYLGGDTAYVALHHTVRITMVVLLAPLFYRLLKRFFSKWPMSPTAP